jgi:hypothetical protein
MDHGVPLVTVTWRHATSVIGVAEIDEQRLVLGRRGGSAIQVEREPPSIRFDLAEPPLVASLVHPILTFGISILARWRGDVTLHAGAFETSSGAWGVMGTREAGKSALLAELAKRGYPVVADDLLTIQESSVWAGPNCVDLRPDTAGRFPSARYLGMIDGRPRFRLSTPPSRSHLPLQGLFILNWQNRPVINVELIPPAERLHLLYQQEYISLLGWPEPRKIIQLLRLPVWRVTRPADWEATDDAVDRLLALTASHP